MEHLAPPIGPVVLEIGHVVLIFEKVRVFLWAFVECAFLALLSIILIFLILGDASGVFVRSVADNVLKFAGAVPTPSLIGLAIVGLLVYAIALRLR